jgi:PadR family transcriptional regulator PadR
MTNTEILVLRTLYNKELSGLQTIQSIADIKGKSLDIGSFYPVFQKLEEKELIKSRWGTERSSDRGGARKRYYRLTRSGEKALADIQGFNNSLNWDFV